ncbi:type III effector HrpK domain-containing protein, partial [Pseudomonas sp.]|uniref:type III effector HrpK domain-containing protein n=1 Tax=Pseudomonas sp. TaxID=306 RepID=UPI002608C07F
ARMAAEKGPDSAKAMDFINANASLKNAVDVGKHGGKADGKITDGDLKSFADKMQGAADKAGKDLGDYQKKNPNADPQSLEMVRSASLLQANQPLASAADPKHAQGTEGETGVDKFISADGVAALAKDNPGLGGPLKQAATTFSQPGFLNMLDQGGLSGRDLATHSPDKKFDSANISNWIKNQAPTTGGEFSSMLSDAATLNAVADVDISKLDKDVFEEPENYTGEQKAAVMVKLQQTQQSVAAGSDLRKTGDTEKALDEKIGQLQADPDVQAFMTKAVPDQERSLVNSDPSLQQAVKTQYQSLLSGKALKSDMDTADKAADKDKNKDATPDYSSAIGGLSSQLQMQQDLQGPDARVPSAQQIVSDHPGTQAKLARSYQANFTEGGAVKQLLGQKKTDASTALATADARKASYESVLPNGFLQRQQDGYLNSTMAELQDSKKGRDFLKKPADGQEGVEKSSTVSNAEKLATKVGPDALKSVTGLASVSGMLDRGDKTGAAKTIYDSTKSGITGAKSGYDAVAKMAGRDASAGLGRMAGQVGGRVAGMIAGEATGLAAAEAIGAAAGPVGWVIDAAMSLGFGIAAIIAAVKKHNAQKAFDHNVDPTLDQFGIPKPK